MTDAELIEHIKAAEARAPGFKVLIAFVGKAADANGNHDLHWASSPGVSSARVAEVVAAAARFAEEREGVPV